MVLDIARESAQGVIQRWVIAGAAAVLLLQGCSIDPYQPAPPPPTTWRSTPAPAPLPSVGDDIAVRAISLLGKPYVWGGADLTGFDCSGLVRFIYDQVGIPVPRTAAEQFSAAKPIDLAGLKPGDLLFFRTRGQRISHVAIYTGGGASCTRRAPVSRSNPACSTTSTTGRASPAPDACSRFVLVLSVRLSLSFMGDAAGAD
jgi:hypothetical protein